MGSRSHCVRSELKAGTPLIMISCQRLRQLDGEYLESNPRSSNNFRRVSLEIIGRVCELFEEGIREHCRHEAEVGSGQLTPHAMTRERLLQLRHRNPLVGVQHVLTVYPRSIPLRSEIGILSFPFGIPHGTGGSSND